MKVVLLHALPLDERMWEPQQEVLSDYDVVAPRLYGFGNSMEAWADRVLAAVPGELVVVGASMGGYCGLAVARRAPERLAALLLAGSRPDPDTPERRRGRSESIEVIRREGAEGLWETLGPKLFSPSAPASLVERARAIALEQQPDGLVAAVEAIRDRADATDVVRQLGDSFLLALGDRDPFVPMEEARTLVGERLRVMRGAGHLPNLERPDEFNELLLSFLERWT